jgi:hypothetical protein
MTPTFTPIDEFTRVSPVGLRFWDPVTGVSIRDGLSLAVQGADPPARVSVSPSGVFILSGLPGLAAVEAGAGDQAFWSSPPETTTVIVNVDDNLGRYLPYSVRVEAPTRGIAQPLCAAELGATESPPVAGLVPLFAPPIPGATPLFSSVAQIFPAGLAVVRAWLWDVAGNVPAASALMQVSRNGEVSSIGLADEMGRVVVALPYPPLPIGLASPPAGAALTAQTWSIDVTFRYDPGTAKTGTPGHPDLCALVGQPTAQALASESPVAALTSARLLYGADTVLATDGQACLLIEPATSPRDPIP